MDLGELPTGVESPLIPILIWTLFALATIVGLLTTLVAVRRGRRRRVVLLVGSALLVVALIVGMTIRNRYGLANLVDDQLCLWQPAGTHYEGSYLGFADGPPDPFGPYLGCLRLQYRVAAWTLGDLLLTITGVIALRRISRPIIF